MNKKQWLRVGSFWGGLCCLLFLFYVLQNQMPPKEGILPKQSFHGTKEILLFEETPIDIIFTLKQVFPEYTIRKQKERHLAKFLAGSHVTMAYEIQAKPLLEKGNLYFYPLYEDPVIVAVDKRRVFEEIGGWEEIKESSHSINLPEKDPQQRYIWMALSYGLTGEVQKETARDFWREIYREGRLFWNNRAAPIQVLFHSSYLYSDWQKQKMELLYPREGSLSFRVGLLSHQELSAEALDTIQQLYTKMGYQMVVGGEKPYFEVEDEKKIAAATDFFKECMAFGEINTAIDRHIKEKLRFAPNTDVEHHIGALLLMIVIVLGISYVHKTVIHVGVRRGVIFTGFILVGWILTGVFKYSFYGSPSYIRILWYSYYFYLLMLPPTSLYIAANIECWDKVVFPKWLFAAGFFSALLMIMILSNDFHQMAFRFLVSDRNLWHKYYRRNIGYYLVAIWMMTAQMTTWIYLVRKSWDSPKRKMAILPILVLILGIIYSLMYNLQIALFRNIPLVLGMSSIVLLFWATLLKSGLVPSNYGYHKLFENSQLKMRILDLQGNLRYQSAISEFDRQREEDMERPFIMEENSLIWSTNIRGGMIVSKEDISELSELKRDLENITKELEEENKILSEKEQVKSKLILLREQNKLTEEVNHIVEDKIKKMKQQLERMKNSGENPQKGLRQLERLAIYCKRRCELLIKSKQQEFCMERDMTRLIEEINAVSSKEYTFFFGLEEGLPFPLAAEAYECYHLFCGLAAEENIFSMTARLFQEDGEIFLYFLAEGNGEQLWKKLAQSLTGSDVMSYKNMGDAFSIIVCLKGENDSRK